VPEHFKVSLFDGENVKPTPYRSKAVGEPPLMLALSAFFAVRDAVSAIGRAQGSGAIWWRRPRPSASCWPARRYALGPALGQCCGGVVHLQFEPLGPADAASLPTRLQGPRTPVALFGGGHVGHALARVLAPLPFALTWIDSRDGIFSHPPEGVVCEHSDPCSWPCPAGQRAAACSS
jgi:hypothetical protein